ncbi:MAG: lamin tail domain-containing protein [Anaerolineae bacterium]|nr:lamin tail domain-containing protein [Anaerolineae bacterium]
MKDKRTKFDTLRDWVSVHARPILIGAVLLGILDLILLRTAILLADAPLPAPTTTAVVATTVVVATPVQQATPTSAAEPTWTPPPTQSPTATPAATMTQVAEPTLTQVAEPTSTPVVWPTHTPTPAITEWRGEYFGNTMLSGTPALVRNDSAINFVWGDAAPAGGLPADGFSARWTRALHFDGGLYRFRATMDDGMRVYLNGEAIIDTLQDGAARERTVDLTLAAGIHKLIVVYYERSGAAVAQFSWEKLADYPDWKGEYWPNLKLEGQPALVRNDKAANGTPGIDLNWQQGSPDAALPANGFSARWTRKASFERGTYRFHVLVDDGVRLWVDDQLLIDAWYDHSAHELVADLSLVRAAHEVKVEYYEQSGQARIKVWWENVDLTFTDWKGEYWPNKDLNGAPALVRNVKSPAGTLGIEFNWGAGAAAIGLPQDNFSARWSRQVTFSSGVYRFYAQADDAVRVYLDQTLIINEWHGFQNRVYQVDLPLNGAHSVRAEYAEHTGDARAKIWWTRLGDLPTPTPPATPTSTATAVPTPTATATPTAMPTSTATAVPTATATATATTEPTATPTATPISTATAVPTPTTTVHIDELLPVPLSIDWDGNGIANGQDEWIELYNAGTEAIDLSDWSLEASVYGLAYAIPDGTMLGAGEFLVLYRAQSGLALNDGGDTVRLLDAAGAVIDSVTWDDIGPDASYGRTASGEWAITASPSPGAANL